MSDVCKKCFHLIDAFMQMCPQGGLCESAPPQPVAAQEMTYCKRRGCNVGGPGTLNNGYCYQHQPSPAATTQPEPKPATQACEHKECEEHSVTEVNGAGVHREVWLECVACKETFDYDPREPQGLGFEELWNKHVAECEAEPSLEEEGFARWGYSAAQAPLLEKIAELESALRREERDSDQLMNERDEAVDVAERLSDAISKYFKTDIGEHSNLNDPFENAVEVIESRLAELESAQPKKDKVFDLLWEDIISEAEVEPSPEEETFARWGWNMASGDYANGFIDGRETGYHTCGSCEHAWEVHDGECGAHMKDGSICGCPRVISAQPKAEPVEKLVSDEELVRLVYEFNLQDSRQLIYESEKDGIDIEVPTHNYRLLADYLLYRQREERSGE